jgi:hypothetical protein
MGVDRQDRHDRQKNGCFVLAIYLFYVSLALAAGGERGFFNAEGQRSQL